MGETSIMQTNMQHQINGMNLITTLNAYTYYKRFRDSLITYSQTQLNCVLYDSKTCAYYTVT